MITWHVLPILYPPSIIKAKSYPCRVCNSRIYHPIEASAMMCSLGGAEWISLKSRVILPVYCCSELCASMFILSVA
jgi:hypothetical protein